MARFRFPFAPYPLQDTLMTQMYDVMARREVGVFESPTGTVGIRVRARTAARVCQGARAPHPHPPLLSPCRVKLSALSAPPSRG